MSMTVIEHIEVGSGGAASVTFTSGGVFANYTDLMLVSSTRTGSVSVSTYIDIYLNTDTSAGNYVNRTLEGNGSSASSESRTQDYEVFFGNGSNATANTFSNAVIYLPNINSSAYKSISTDSVTENNGTTGGQLLVAAIWNDTAAITSIELKPAVDSWVQYSSFTLYGITAGSDGTTTVS